MYVYIFYEIIKLYISPYARLGTIYRREHIALLLLLLELQSSDVIPEL